MLPVKWLRAPLTEQQMAAGSSKLDSTQTAALRQNFSSPLSSVSSNPPVEAGISKAIAPKRGGIADALI